MTDREKEVEEYLKKKERKRKMQKSNKKTVIFATESACLVCCILTLVYRIRNPHLTETEVILYVFSKYWWLCIMVFIAGLIK